MKTTRFNFRDNITALLAPGFLVAIALSHLVWTHTSAQSPWKGGGFGMFSTIASPASRVVKARLFTPEGMIPIQVPKEFGKAEGRIRTMPTQPALDALARAIGTAAWAPVSMTPVGQQYEALAQGSTNQQDLTADLNQMLARMNMVGMLAADEPRDLALHIDAVEVVCYQIGFDAVGKRLTLEPLVQSRLDFNTQVPR